MEWKVRHQGSPRPVEGLSLDQVADGLRDGLWRPTDELQEPGASQWVSLEDHAALADVADEVEGLSRPIARNDETHVDMVPLIDVCMVLLVFFILTTSYQALEKVLQLPQASGQRSDAEAASLMVKVRARPIGDGRVQYEIEGHPTAGDRLTAALAREMKDKGQFEVLIDAEGVDWGSVVRIIDAAGGAQVRKVHFVVGGRPAE